MKYLFTTLQWNWAGGEGRGPGRLGSQLFAPVFSLGRGGLRRDAEDRGLMWEPHFSLPRKPERQRVGSRCVGGSARSPRARPPSVRGALPPSDTLPLGPWRGCAPPSRSPGETERVEDTPFPLKDRTWTRHTSLQSGFRHLDTSSCKGNGEAESLAGQPAAAWGFYY